MKQYPEDRPFTPSMRFMAFMIPTEAKIVSGIDTQTGIVSTPQSPHRQSMELLLMCISHITIRISIMNLILGVRLKMSSMVPVYSIIIIAAMSMNTLGLLNMICELHKPSTMPKKTAMPPITGTGVRWSLRASGLSTRFFMIAIFRI